MSERAQRAAFEAWIGAFPYERELDRIPDDPENFWWAGEYRDLTVQLAWEAWREAGRAAAEQSFTRSSTQ